MLPRNVRIKRFAQARPQNALHCLVLVISILVIVVAVVLALCFFFAGA